jgi:hypothetical protein
MEGTLFDQVVEFKNRLKNFIVHRKKLRALENYSECSPFHHKDYLTLIKRCMKDGFLGEEEARFLSFMIQKYEVNFLDWSHRTKWLKSEMQRLASNYKEDQPVQTTMFDFNKMRQSTTAHVPFELLAQQQKQKMTRRI